MKIVVPIMPRSLDEANQIDISKFEQADIIEWRADYLDKNEILTVAPAIFEKFAGHEVIFTLRTVKEGGHINLTDAEYVTLLKDVQSLYQPDYLDFEYFSYKTIFEELREFSNLVLSHHNFDETPENLLEVFSELTALAPKVVKIAVMPEVDQDVLDLMNYTRGFKALNPDQSYATISMGKLGRLSRLSSDIMGSCWTFVSLEKASAPGQIELKDMLKIKEILDAD